MFFKVNKFGHRVNLNQILYTSLEEAEGKTRVIFHGPYFQIVGGASQEAVDKSMMKMMDVQIKSDYFDSAEAAEKWLEQILNNH